MLQFIYKVTGYETGFSTNSGKAAPAEKRSKKKAGEKEKGNKEKASEKRRKEYQTWNEQKRMM